MGGLLQAKKLLIRGSGGSDMAVDHSGVVHFKLNFIVKCLKFFDCHNFFGPVKLVLELTE